MRRLETEIEASFFRYVESTRVEGFAYPAFWYREQQTKTFITMALGNLCAGSVLQEPPIRRSTKEGKSSGRVDYYCQFGGKALLLEFKQRWLGGAQLSLHRLKSTHSSVAEQIRSLDKKYMVKEWDAYFGLGITLAPIYLNALVNHKTDKTLDERLEVAIETLRKDRNVSAVSYFKNKVNAKKSGERLIVSWAKKQEEYPGVLMLWYGQRF
jgi:hypothetical protein